MRYRGIISAIFIFFKYKFFISFPCTLKQIYKPTALLCYLITKVGKLKEMGSINMRVGYYHSLYKSQCWNVALNYFIVAHNVMCNYNWALRLRWSSVWAERHPFKIASLECDSTWRAVQNTESTWRALHNTQKTTFWRCMSQRYPK